MTSILIFALIPAICEEFAFRGFILSGLEHQHRVRSAILLSALMFGFLHVLLSLFQQLFNATLLGMVLGLLAVRSRSILPGIVFHFLNNAFAVALGSVVHAPWAARDRPLDLSQPGRRALSWAMDRGERACFRASCCSFSGSPSQTIRPADQETPGRRAGVLTPGRSFVTGNDPGMNRPRCS